MIERVHEHLTGELRQNTRTDTIFIITALFLNLIILAVNSGISGRDDYDYTPIPTLTEGSHTLYIEIEDRDRSWMTAGRIDITFSGGTSGSELEDSGFLYLPDRPVDIRYQLDSYDEAGWAAASMLNQQDETTTLLMFVFILLQVLVNAAVLTGLLKGRKMRMIILDGLLEMYRDQNIEKYYNKALLKSYSVRYFIFITIVILVGIISIIVPLILRFM